MAAINPTVGDLAGNSAEVVRAAAAAAQEGAHLIVFPEMVLTGYPVEDLALRSSFRQASKKAIAALATELAEQGHGDLVAIVGYLDEAPSRWTTKCGSCHSWWPRKSSIYQDPSSKLRRL